MKNKSDFQNTLSLWQLGRNMDENLTKCERDCNSKAFCWEYLGKNTKLRPSG